MKEIKGDLHKYSHYFEGYSDNIPVIYSTLEGQYQGSIYCDDEEVLVVLVTKFGFIFPGGNIECENAEDTINDIIFNELVLRQQYKEIIVFAPNENWYPVLDKVFESHHGVSDIRKCYKLNKDRFINAADEFKLDNIRVEVKHERENDSAIEYPVARVYADNVNVSYCSAFMLAKGCAEIDVATIESYRQKGYAKIGAIALIKDLLKQDIEPCWCTWPYRVESQTLAQAIGFELNKVVRAYIWVDEFGF